MVIAERVDTADTGAGGWGAAVRARANTMGSRLPETMSSSLVMDSEMTSKRWSSSAR